MAERIFRRVKRRRPTFTDDDLLLTVRILSRRHFQTVEDVLEFLAKFRQQEVNGELAAMMKEPATDDERAEMLVIRSLMSQSMRMKARYAHEALQLNPNSVSALNALGDASIDVEDALTAYRRAVEILYGPIRHLFPMTTDQILSAPRELLLWFKIMFNLARVAREAGHYDESIETVKKLLQSNPTDDIGARAELIASYIMKGSFREARVILESLEKEDAVSLTFHAFLAYLLNEDLNEAFRSFDEAITLNPYLAGHILGEVRQEPIFEDANVNLEEQAGYIFEIVRQIFACYPDMEEAFATAILSSLEAPDED